MGVGNFEELGIAISWN